MENILTSDMLVRHEILGIDGILNPFLDRTSSQRQSMSSGYYSQSVIIDGSEQAKCFTGTETVVGKYEMVPELKNDIQVISIIPKFRINMGNAQLSENPTKTVVYRDLKTKKVSYFDISTYEPLADGFGYKNKMTRSNHLLSENNLISAGTRFTTSPNHDEGFYKQGLNLNTIYMTNLEVTEDAFVISKSAAKKMEHTAISTCDIYIPLKSIPLNNYGNEENYQIFPDVGELVNDDGVLMAFRPKHDDTFLSDIKKENLMSTEYLHDNIYYAVPGAEIIDVQVYIDHRNFRNQKNHTGPYAQLFKYQEQHNWYYDSIIKLYHELKNEGEQFSSKFNQLIVQVLQLRPAIIRKGNDNKLYNKKEPIDFAYVKIAYMYKRKISLGFKLSARYGD